MQLSSLGQKSIDYCHDNGNTHLRLASYLDICPDSKNVPSNLISKGNGNMVWAPIADKTNDWVYVGTKGITGTPKCTRISTKQALTDNNPSLGNVQPTLYCSDRVGDSTSFPADALYPEDTAGQLSGQEEGPKCASPSTCKDTTPKCPDCGKSCENSGNCRTANFAKLTCYDDTGSRISRGEGNCKIMRWGICKWATTSCNEYKAECFPVKYKWKNAGESDAALCEDDDEDDSCVEKSVKVCKPKGVKGSWLSDKPAELVESITYYETSANFHLSTTGLSGAIGQEQKKKGRQIMKKWGKMPPYASEDKVQRYVKAAMPSEDTCTACYLLVWNLRWIEGTYSVTWHAGQNEPNTTLTLWKDVFRHCGFFLSRSYQWKLPVDPSLQNDGSDVYQEKCQKDKECRKRLEALSVACIWVQNSYPNLPTDPKQYKNSLEGIGNICQQQVKLQTEDDSTQIVTPAICNPSWKREAIPGRLKLQTCICTEKNNLRPLCPGEPGTDDFHRLCITNEDLRGKGFGSKAVDYASESQSDGNDDCTGEPENLYRDALHYQFAPDLDYKQASAMDCNWPRQ